MALEELCEAVHDLPAAGAERDEHLDLVARLKDRVQLARDWEACAAELLDADSPAISLEELKVCILLRLCLIRIAHSVIG